MPSNSSLTTPQLITIISSLSPEEGVWSKIWLLRNKMQELKGRLDINLNLPLLPVLHCYLCNTATCATLLPVQHCYLYYTATCATLLPVQHCYLYYTANMCNAATCATLLPVQHCYLCNTATCATLLPVQHCYLYNTATCITLLPVQHCYLYNTGYTHIQTNKNKSENTTNQPPGAQNLFQCPGKCWIPLPVLL